MKLCRSVALIGFVCITLFSFQPAHAQFRQQGSKLVGTGTLGTSPLGSSQQGTSVALSSDGNTAIIGGVLDNGQIGAAWVWTRSGAVWTQQQKLVGVDSIGSSLQGFSVALSSDGNTAIVGGAHDNNRFGAAWVWTRSGGVWTQQGNKLVGSGDLAGAQGYAVGLSANGDTAIIGGPTDNSSVGAAWVFTRTGGVWTEQGKLAGAGAVGNAEQGTSVSLSDDGNTAIVGGVQDNQSAGASWVWIRSAGVWTQQGSKLVGSGAVGTAQQGYSTSLSTDGNTAIIGGLTDNNGTGAAWIWTRSGGVWSQQSKVISSGAVGSAYQGYAVSLSGDGNTAVMGGPVDNGDTGAAWVWTRSGGLWSQSDKLLGSGAAGKADQGISVCLSRYGTTAIVGGAYDAAGTGAAWVYEAPVQRRRVIKH